MATDHDDTIEMAGITIIGQDVEKFGQDIESDIHDAEKLVKDIGSAIQHGVEKCMDEAATGQHNADSYFKGNEMAVDHIYSQKFSFASSESHLFKSTVDSYLNAMLNKIGIVFFKAQTYYSDDAENNRAACIIDFHLFSIECLTKDDKEKISQHVEEFLHELQETRLVSTEILIHAQTKLKRPVYT